MTSKLDWFAHDQGGWWNALLLAEFPGALYDDRGFRSPLVSYVLSQCIDGWLRTVAGVRFRERRLQHTLLVDPYRHLNQRVGVEASGESSEEGKGTSLDDDRRHIRGLHFWSALTVATRSTIFHPCSHEDHFEAGDFVVQTKNANEGGCGGPCWANSWMGLNKNGTNCQVVGADKLCLL